MDQIKIGRFIAEKRKEQKLTQKQIAEKLGVTDRAVSKWETGKSLPDASLMLELCGMLKITVNDLLSGEVVSMNEYNERTEKNLIAMVKEKELADKRMLMLEIVMFIIVMAFWTSVILIVSFIDMPTWIRVVLTILGIAVFFCGTFFSVRIEQVAGYYECSKCGHKYVPKYSSVLFSMHMGRTHYMKCPHCKKRSWQKKVISKE